MKKLITMPFLVLLLGVMLTACGTTNQSSDNKKEDSKKETTEAADQNKDKAADEKSEDQSSKNEKSDDQSKETAAQTEEPASQSDEEAKDSSSKEITKEEPAKDQSKADSKGDSKTKKESTTSKKNEVTKEGTYVGLADGHTIAVNIDGKEVAIQFGNTFSKQVNSLKEESKVKVTYTKDANGTLRLKTIESVKAK
ncbi:hypothetical protein [Bacillus safensis]|uniref:hypothetical protein n=1 Tax=Bacillus TaxID=1386 RepID=UPI000BA76F54|nr:hypothetical protein [Bacillus safensis]MBG9816178.1 hypothetical protein [Bacillus safensis]OYN64229.1 hypothetical protein CFH85_16775 [Bacillus safensis]QRF31865.1 hypothetical protein JNE45_16515 [Bacillus safensis]UQZ94461.1 hypothetical protein EI692_16335 [Bacillus safensis]